MKTVIKKIDPEWFGAIQEGKKKYELRLADFDMEDGDILRLEEWVGSRANRKPTGRYMEKKIAYVRKVDLKGWIKSQPELIDKGFYVLQFE